MKRLTCEMCGSTDLIKDGGVFVCQACGCKYSVEEAKKMMVEGTVEVTGTVKVDNSDKIDTYKTIAVNAYNSGNYNEAQQYFLKVLEIDPTDYQCIFYKGMCQGVNTTLANPRVREAVAAYDQAEQYIPDDIKQSVQESFIEDLTRLMSAWLELAADRYRDVDDWYSSNVDIFWDYLKVANEIIGYIDDYKHIVFQSDSIELKKNVGQLYCDACYVMCLNIVQWTNYSKNSATFPGLSLQRKEPFLKDYDNMIFEIRKSIPDFNKITNYNGLILGTIDRDAPPTSIGPHNIGRSEANKQRCLLIDREIDERVKAWKRKERINQYWQEHAEEKQQYDARIKEIDNEIKQLQSQLEPYDTRIIEIKKDLSQYIPEEGKLKELNRQQTDLYSAKSKLGLFAGKQKKQIQTQIDALQSRIDDLAAEVKRKNQEIQNVVSEKISAIEIEKKPIKDHIDELAAEKRRINMELSKER